MELELGLASKKPVYRVQLVREGSESRELPFIQSSADAYQCLKDSAPSLFDGDREIFVVIYLNAKHCAIWIDPLFLGTIDLVMVHPREILKRVLLCNAANIIIAHNHPSGRPNPSSEDEAMTKCIQKACELFDIKLLDHLIIGEGSKYFSFQDKGIMPNTGGAA